MSERGNFLGITAASNIALECEQTLDTVGMQGRCKERGMRTHQLTDESTFLSLREGIHYRQEVAHECGT